MKTLFHWCDEEEISASHIALFIRYLTELVQSMQCTNSYGFLCPTLLSKFASFENEENRSDYIIKAMTCTGCESGRKLIFAPYFEDVLHSPLGPSYVDIISADIYWRSSEDNMLILFQIS
ncbi:uncharacterized protein LOC141633448 [Silene latifolia]|uniref:uncharacterized protein LOC141633448 n=1 Tax=Silene latifolia TaxID=37657 RepID=UPI003D76CE4E